MRIRLAFIYFAIGIGVGYFGNSASQDRHEDHWQAVEIFRRYIEDPDVWVDSSQPPYPEQSLAALVQAGILSHVDIVFPNVPYEQNGLIEDWRRRCSSNTNIVFSFINHCSQEFRASGVQPLHANIWFKDEATKDLKRMINDIDDVWAIKPGASGTVKMQTVGGGGHPFFN